MQTHDTTIRVLCTPPTVDDALALAACGLQIIPCAPRTKQPARDLTDWQDLATLDQDTIRNWWQDYPGANIGTVVPQGHLVIDIDPRNGGLTQWEKLCAQHGALPATWKALSGRQDGGVHLHLTTEYALADPNVIDLAPGVQVLGPGHLVIVPPSIHPDTGQRYQWNEEHNPETMWAPAEVPVWLLNLMRWTHAATRDQAKKSPRSAGSHPSDDALCLGASNKVPQDLPPPLGTLFTSGEATSPTPRNCTHGAAVVADATNPNHLPALLKACRLPESLQVGANVRCPFPNHTDEHPSAVLLGVKDAHRSFGIFCHACRRYMSLVDLLKSRIGGDEIPLHSETDHRGKTWHHNRLRLMWTTRLLEVAGIRVFQELGAPSLPPDAPPEAHKLWEVALHVRRIRSATGPIDAPFDFSLRFIRDWCGPSYHWAQKQLTAARRWLIKRGFLRFDHKEGLDTFWRIGSRALRRALVPFTFTLDTDKKIIAAVASVELPPLPVHEGTPCPEAHEFSHKKDQCLQCIYARQLERREQHGIYVDPGNPYAEHGRILEVT